MKVASIILVSALAGSVPPQQSVEEYCAQGCVVMSHDDWRMLQMYVENLKMDTEMAKKNSRGMCA
jgi:hypothetical protein